LKSLKAIDGEDKLTCLGKTLSMLPVMPHIGKMILLGCCFGCLDPILTIAASHDIDPFLTSKNLKKEVQRIKTYFSFDSLSDHIAVVNAFLR
jgi:ATP-dependent RNA helicase DHX36